MRTSGLRMLLASFILPFLLSSPAAAAPDRIVDILANAARYWNMTVTLAGQVRSVASNPSGTTGGTYALLDESCPYPITVRTNELPPVGRKYFVTGIILQDPLAPGTPVLKEVSRSSPGLAATTLMILLGAGALFLILLVVFIVNLSKPKKNAAPGTDAVPLSVNLGASIIIDRGPDRGKEFSLHKPVMTIGRPGARKNDIELEDDTVSKEQASIYYDNVRRTYSITNESATNPTKADGQPISGPTLVGNDAVIEMGRTILRFKKS